MALRDVDKVADTSRNLKGVFVRALRVAAVKARAVVAELEARADPPSSRVSKLAKANEFLRKRVETLEEEVRDLKGRLAAAEEVAAPLAGGSPARPSHGGTGDVEGDEIHFSPPRRGSPRTSAPPRAPMEVDVEVCAEEAPTAVGVGMGGVSATGSDLVARVDALIAAHEMFLERLAVLEGGGSSLLTGPPPDEAAVKKTRGRGAARRAAARTEVGLSLPPLAPRTAATAVDSGRRKKQWDGGGMGRAPTAPPDVTPVSAGGKNKAVKAKKVKKKKQEEGAGVVGRSGPPPAQTRVAASVADARAGPTPPAVKQAETETWARVVGRRARRVMREANSRPAPRLPDPPQASKRWTVLPRPPRYAAVLISPRLGVPLDAYAEAVRSARRAVSLADLGIERPRSRRAANGGLVIEIPGPNGDSKADLLMGRLMEFFGEDGDARVSRPSKHAEVRVRGLDDSVVPSEVAEALALAGGCRVDEVRVGELRRAPNGLASVWAQCPATAVARALKTGRKLSVGWGRAVMEPLPPRPMMYHRCLGQGHVRARCGTVDDRSDRCYRCGRPGHLARGCAAPLECPVCKDLGLPAAHRVGSRGCNPPKKPPPRVVGSRPAPGPSGLPEASPPVRMGSEPCVASPTLAPLPRRKRRRTDPSVAAARDDSGTQGAGDITPLPLTDRGELADVPASPKMVGSVPADDEEVGRDGGGMDLE